MPVGEHNIMFEQAWNSSAILLTPTDASDAMSEQWKENVKTNNLNAPSISTGRIQCPMCRRFFPARDFGRCPGVPTADFPQSGANTRKRKRTETRAAHEISFAPCSDCLDQLGEDEGGTWGRCDNPRCWSRKGEALSGKTSGMIKTSGVAFLSDDQNHWGAYSLIATDESLNHLHLHLDESITHGGELRAGLGLVCPKCSPDGGLGCAHKWICDICSFWEKHPLVWECPGCFNDYCDECEEADIGGIEQERCTECGKRDLCRACRNGNSPTRSDCDSPQCDLKSESPSIPGLFAWRCWLCSLPVCSGCVHSAVSNKRIDPCRNCLAHLCEGCRSVLWCQRCGGEMCQFCSIDESLIAMLCHKCEHGS